jgi:hypothetical protein
MSARRTPIIVVVLVFALGLLATCLGSIGPSEARAPNGQHRPFRFFSPTSVWNRKVPEDTRIDPRSPALISNLASEVATEIQEGRGPSINTDEFSVPIHTVPRNQPRVTVALHSRPLRRPLPSLRRAWSSVPLPPGARPAAGTDRTLVVWQPSRDTLWEFWRLQRTPKGPKAAWGGAIRDVSQSSGIYGPHAWPGANASWGSSASSLSIVGGLITFGDFQRGRINHALAMSIPEVRAGVYASPANRTDGASPNPLALPEGAHLRLDPQLDLTALNLPPPTLMLARAAQQYGIIVRDHAGIIVFYGQDPNSSLLNPYLGPYGYFDGYRPGELMAAFPWSYLEVLKMHLHRSCSAYLPCP